MGFFSVGTERKGNGYSETNTPQVKNPETADVAIHIVGDARTEQATGFLRYLKPRQGTYRQCIHLSHEVHGKFSRVVRTLGVNGSTIGGYIENVLKEHFRTYRNDISALIRHETSQPL